MATPLQKNDIEIPIDRRTKAERRSPVDRRENDVPVAEERRTGERRKVARRRQIDPTTCERDYTNDELEFMHALDDYKRVNGRMFPTCSEILEVVNKLGYQKRISDELSFPDESLITDDVIRSDDPLEERAEQDSSTVD